jgi:RNA polymerase sigma-70 factor (ECF subfamily)
VVRLDALRGIGFFVGRDYDNCGRLLILTGAINPTVTHIESARNKRRAETERGAEAADEAGLKAAFVTYGGELFGFARRSLGDNGLAEEAVQETFMRAWRSRDRFDSTLGSLRGWLFAIERRAVIDLAHKRASNDTDQLVHDPAAVDGQAEQAMLGWQVEEALRRLRPEHRSVVQDIYFRNLPGREVAARLGVPEGTVRSRLFYALRSLRLVLEEMGWEQ